MEIELRLEEEKDYRTVEVLTREAFWNEFVPGCEEHLLIHNMRKAEAFVKELDFVALYQNEIVGNIVYVKSKIKDADKEWTILTFGPISVLPKYQNRGIGSKLIEHTKKLAKNMGYKAIIIYGDPAYYSRFGFEQSKKYAITNKEGKYPAALLVLELYQDALKGVRGVFDVDSFSKTGEKELEEFEKGFVKKEKQKTESQERFLALAMKYL
jgi:predicted N-acetyltransferase YhbS